MKEICKHTGLERLPSMSGSTLTSCCHDDAREKYHLICQMEKQYFCSDYEKEVE